MDDDFIQCLAKLYAFHSPLMRFNVAPCAVYDPAVAQMRNDMEKGALELALIAIRARGAREG